MPKVLMHVTGRAVGASGERDAFTEMVRVVVAGIADHARAHVRVGADDDVSIEVTVERRLQSDVGEALEQLLSDAVIQSAVVDADGHPVDPPDDD